ncbi:ParB/RepB/Spo0J family partition protein [Treponema sp.]|uniref:ParB/RepB/Spo0J family partition protein n=1 Tax=Treponema sp. TaxID=166 RepID=UPI0025F4891A|nr:ParB/RepB/Spo0J family partition protein [Treponema sp.]MBR4321793.1 ParB N-terminal domain-containing protein [Treponema sp.]
MPKTNILAFLDKDREGKIIKINLDEITMQSELKNAFHMNIDVKDRIKADIAENGFSKAHPIHIFKWKENWVLCDGHTRYTAAKELGLKTVWAQVHQFKSINEALLFSMKEQFNRRNIEDSDLFKQFETLRQEEIEGRKLTAAEMSERLHKSKRHIFKLQEVFAKSSKEQIKAIREGNASINQIYNEIKKQEHTDNERQQDKNPVPAMSEVESEKILQNVEEVSETIDAETENQIQKDLQKERRKLQNKELELKEKESKLHKRLSDRQILMLGAKYALIEKAKGKPNSEILEFSAFSEKINASDISFTDEELELLKIC